MMQLKEFDIVLDIKTKEVKYRDPVSGQKLDEIEVIKGDYKSKGTNISMIRGDSEIINNLTSTAIDKALSANMGRELFQSVSNGKDLIATAITDKGGSASGSDTFGELASAIGQISSGKKWASGSTSAGGSTLSVRGLPFKPGVFFCKRTGSDSTSNGNRARSSIYVKKEVVGMSFDIIIGFGTATSLFLPNVATYEDGIDISVSLIGNYNWIAFE